MRIRSASLHTRAFFCVSLFVWLLTLRCSLCQAALESRFRRILGCSSRERQAYAGSSHLPVALAVGSCSDAPRQPFHDGRPGHCGCSPRSADACYALRWAVHIPSDHVIHTPFPWLPRVFAELSTVAGFNPFYMIASNCHVNLLCIRLACVLRPYVRVC